MILKCEVYRHSKGNLIFSDNCGNLAYTSEYVRSMPKRSVIYLKDKNENFLYWMMKKSQKFRNEYIIDDFVSGKPLYAYCKGKKIYIFIEKELSPLILKWHMIKKNFEVYLGSESILTAFSKGMFSFEYTMEFQSEKYKNLCICLTIVLFDLLTNEFISSKIRNGFLNMGA